MVLARRVPWVLLSVLVIGLGLLVVWSAFGRRASSATPFISPDEADSERQTSTLQVEVTKPALGGMDRSITVPATVIAYESANLFAKISGYLEKQPVDIGDQVRAGQVLAEIDSPEYVKAVDQAKAAVDQAQAQVVQADARVLTAEADQEAAAAAITKAQADVLHYKGARELSEKQFKRMKDLYSTQSIEQRLVDEQQSDLQSAQSAEDSALAGIVNAKALANAARARVQQAKADVVAARANVEVLEAALARAEVFVSYLKITAPFDGVVTKRHFFHGDFIRSADQQGLTPLLVVDRTDRMRIVVQVPDRDVPLTRPGVPATVTIDALPGKRFAGKVSRIAAAEHSETRTMRAEIDLENDKGILCHGMYGYATIHLPSVPGAMRIPLSALVGITTDAVGTVHVVKDGVVRSAKVRVGRDDGLQTEILEGLSADDQVVSKHSAELVDGTKVNAMFAKGNASPKSPSSGKSG